MSTTNNQPECVCAFLVTNPYACRKCWPDGGSKKEKNIFKSIVEAERRHVLGLEK